MTTTERDRAPGERRAEKTTAASAVYRELKRDLLRGVLKPGERLLIDQVAARYAAGANPVREALNRLSAERMVDREDQRGFSVPPLSLEAFRELVKTRCWLEGKALEESIKNRTEPWEEALVLAFHRLSRAPIPEAAGQDGALEWERRHRAFHRALISGCGSSWLLRFCDELMDQVERYRYISMTSSPSRRDSLTEHRLILEAALDGRANLAVERLVTQYEFTLRLYEEQVEEAEAT